MRVDDLKKLIKELYERGGRLKSPNDPAKTDLDRAYKKTYERLYYLGYKLRDIGIQVQRAPKRNEKKIEKVNHEKVKEQNAVSKNEPAGPKPANVLSTPDVGKTKDSDGKASPSASAQPQT
jgi:hypothetical protein